MESLREPKISTPAGTGDVYSKDAAIVGFLNRDAEELLELKERVRVLEDRVDELEDK